MKYKSNGIVRKTHEQIDVKERGLIVGSADRGPGAASSCLSRPDGKQTSVHGRTRGNSPVRGNVAKLQKGCRLATVRPGAMNQAFCVLSTIGRETNVGEPKGSYVP